MSEGHLETGDRLRFGQLLIITTPMCSTTLHNSADINFKVFIAPACATIFVWDVKFRRKNNKRKKISRT